MATKKSQRIFIWVITVFMIVGTIGSFAVLILSSETSKKDSARLAELTKQYEDQQAAYTAKVEKQAAELSKKYYPTFKTYYTYPEKFNIDSVKELKTTDLVKGSGKTIDGTTTFAAYYVGWNSDGKIFDSSFNDDATALGSPFTITGLDNTSVIQGWIDGLKGMKIGGVRLLEIPSDKAYGETGSGDDIPPNAPLKFVVMAIEAPETIEKPTYSQELIDLMGTQQ